MGKRRSVYQLDGKEIIIDPDNKEFVTLRGTFPGEYVLNVHVYSCLRSTLATSAAQPGSPVNVPIIVEIIKINPSYYVVKHIELTMESIWQEKTVVRFTMDSKKNIIRFKNDYVGIRTGQNKSP